MSYQAYFKQICVCDWLYRVTSIEFLVIAISKLTNYKLIIIFENLKMHVIKNLKNATMLHVKFGSIKSFFLMIKLLQILNWLPYKSVSLRIVL